MPIAIRQWTNDDLLGFYRGYADRFPDAAKLLRLGGIDPFHQDDEWINPYTKEEEVDNFGNVGLHSAAVTYCAERIAIAAHLKEGDLEMVLQSAFLHDVGKRFEVDRKIAAKKGLMTEADAYGEAAATISPFFVAKGENNWLLPLVDKSGFQTGHRSLPRLVCIYEGEPCLSVMSSMGTADKIVHVADDMTASPLPGSSQTTTSFVTLFERAARSEFWRRYPILFSRGFGFTPEGNVIDDVGVRDDARRLRHFDTYMHWQLRVMRWLANSLECLFERKKEETPELTLVAIANEQ